MSPDAVRPSLTVCVPALNEEANLPHVLTGIRECVSIPHEVLVVDGGSLDKTRKIAEEMGAQVLVDSGGGKGVAIREALNFCESEVIIFVDADGSHDPADIDKIVSPIFRDEADLVIGSRIRGGSDEAMGDFAKFVRVVGSAIITLGINYRFGVRLTDSQNGFRAIRTELGRRLRLKEDLTTTEQEMLTKALHLRMRVTEVPAHESARRSGDSHINVPRVALRYVYSWLKNLVAPDFRS